MRLRSYIACGLLCWVGACSVVNKPDDPIPPGASFCAAVSECPQTDNPCEAAACDAGACTFTKVAAGETCAGGTCDGEGHCVAGAGESCASPGACDSGFCVDGVCCSSACDGACEGCAEGGSEGTCTPFAAGDNPDGACTAGYACDGAGACKKLDASPCAEGADCLSGFCADGVCCDAECGDPCQDCNAMGSEGTCQTRPDNRLSRDNACEPLTCDGSATTCPAACAGPGDCTFGRFCVPTVFTCADHPAARANGMGGTYLAVGGSEMENARLACESVHGAGNCCNDACGSCNALGYHLCGAPNCDGSVYWDYANDLQDMGCFWTDPNEILISVDGENWTQ